MRISGRNKLLCERSVTAEGVLLRFDCQRDDAFWLEVLLTAEDLTTMQNELTHRANVISDEERYRVQQDLQGQGVAQLRGCTISATHHQGYYLTGPTVQEAWFCDLDAALAAVVERTGQTRETV